jgi:SAM-dependent methyltransferase
MTRHSGARFFDAIAGRYDRVYALPSGESRRRMTRVLGELPGPPARVLDLGVGPGRELSALLDAGYAPTGLDISPAMLEICARRARPIPLVEGDFWRPPLPFADASFDAAVALHGTLAHPPSDTVVNALARELARVVRPGGRFIAEVPSIAWLDAASSNFAADERQVFRTGHHTCRFEDRVAGASIDVCLLDEPGWRKALKPCWIARLQAMGPLEWLIVADRV